MAHNVPVLIGCARRTDHTVAGARLSEDLLARRAPSNDLARVALDALLDAGVASSDVASVCAVRMHLQARAGERLRGGPYRSLAASVAGRAGFDSSRLFVDTTSGGNSPQLLLHEMWNRIRAGTATGVCVIVGGTGRHTP
jgi:hypothetical protein